VAAAFPEGRTKVKGQKTAPWVDPRGAASYLNLTKPHGGSIHGAVFQLQHTQQTNQNKKEEIKWHRKKKRRKGSKSVT
jgi:hypothetical protein